MPEELSFVWREIKDGAWLELIGEPYAAVRVKPTPQGFLWCHGKQYGFADTIEGAKEWAETAREVYPKKL
jgi:hypothetical protein